MSCNSTTERGSNPSVTRGKQNYAAAEREAKKWHEDFGAFDWTFTDIPQAAWTVLEAQG